MLADIAREGLASWWAPLLAFAAGLISCASPCVFPLVPGYVTFVAGAAGPDRGRRRILPILLFVYLLQQVNVLQRGDVQAGLFLALVVAVGGFRMYQGDRSGKNLVIYGIVVAVIAQVVNLIGTIIAYSGLAGLGLGIGAGAIIGFIFWLVIRFIVYYLVVISRFPGEAPLVSSPGGYGAPPPPPPPPPM